MHSCDNARLERDSARRTEERLTDPDGGTAQRETLTTPWIGTDGNFFDGLGMGHEITAPAGEQPVQGQQEQSEGARIP